MLNEEEIFRVLEDIGLSKNEVSIYLDLLRYGKSSANDVSHITGIHRSNVYDILESLLRRGIVDKVVENDKAFFYPVEPKFFIDYLKQKEYELKNIIPELDNLMNKKEEERKVYVTEGLNSVKNILMSLLSEKQPIYIYGMPKEVKELLGPFLNEYHKERIKKGILLNGIYNRSAMKRIRELNQMELTEARYFPSSYDSKISTTICGNKVVLQFWELPTSAIVIENASIAKTYKNYFNILWNEALTLGENSEE